MTMRHLILSALLLCLALPATAQEQPDAGDEQVVLGLSQNTVAITTNFDGSEVLIFGAIKRENPIPPGELEVIVTVAGPSVPLTVWRKSRQLGIWVNDAAVEIDSAPSFYAVATSAPWSDVISETEDLRRRVSVPRAIRSVGAPMTIENAQDFTDALIRVRERNGLYKLEEGTVELDQQTLFSTSISLPANLTEGDYATRILLTREGNVVAEYQTLINVSKVGLERFLFNLAHDQPLLYGLLSLAIAIAAGWGASAGFRALRQR